jgi:hypothetical protein
VAGFELGDFRGLAGRRDVNHSQARAVGRCQHQTTARGQATTGAGVST